MRKRIAGNAKRQKVKGWTYGTHFAGMETLYDQEQKEIQEQRGEAFHQALCCAFTTGRQDYEQLCTDCYRHVV